MILVSNKMISIRLLLILLLINFFLFSTFVYAKKIIFAVDDYCPYYCKDHQATVEQLLDKPGFVIEILEYTFKEQGYDIEYVFMPWERGLAEVHKNTINGIIVASKGNAPALIYPQEEQGSSKGCFVTHTENNWKFTNRDSLSNVRLGVIQGYDYGEPVDSFIWQHHQSDYQISFISGVNALPRLLSMLERKRIDATIDDVNVLRYLLKEMNLNNTVAFANCTDDQVNLYVGFSPKAPEAQKYANMLSKAMTNLRESGKLAIILAKYNLTDWR